VAASGDSDRVVEGRSDPSVDAPAGKFSWFELLADTPIEEDDQDRLGFTAYADALAGLLDDPATSTPLTIAITGPWGSGKTSLAKMVDDRLQSWPTGRGDLPHIVCWFNAWLHDDAPNLGSAFAAEVARVADRNRPWIRQILRPLPMRMLPADQRWRRRLLLLLLCVMPFLLAFAVPQIRKPLGGPTHTLTTALGLGQVAGISAILLVIIMLWTTLASMASTAGRFITDPKGEAAKGSLNYVRKQLEELVHQATETGRPGRRLVIFVDDLERCTPPRAVEVCEKAHQLFGHRDVAVVLIADVAALGASATVRHAAEDEPSYGQRYLEKIVQIQFDLPPVRPEVMRALLEETTLGRQTVPSTDRQTSRSQLGEASRQLVGTLGKSADTVSRHLWVLDGVLLLAGLGLVILGAILGDTDAGLALQTLGFVILLLFVVLIVYLVIRSISRFVKRLRSRSSRARVDQEIPLAAENETDSKRLVSEVMKTASASKSLVQVRVQRYLVEASPARREAEAELLRTPPDLPRTAKRMFNQLRMLFAVAVNSGMLDDKTEVTPAHLGRWIVLQSKWPDLGQALTVNPGCLQQLQASTSPDDLQNQLDSIGVQVPNTEELLRFLREQPTLGHVLNRLLRYVPTTVN
jgi:ABC-type multidrug transport system fused ATPase/permease subunit